MMSIYNMLQLCKIWKKKCRFFVYIKAKVRKSAFFGLNTLGVPFVEPKTDPNLTKRRKNVSFFQKNATNRYFLSRFDTSKNGIFWLILRKKVFWGVSLYIIRKLARIFIRKKKRRR